jgi:hypothetical protein
MAFIIYDESIGRQLGTPYDDYDAALFHAMAISEDYPGHVIRVKEA